MTEPLFWIDLEMTGLNDNVDVILEVAIVLTDLNFKPLEEYHRVVYQPPTALAGMDDWCKKTHGESGLTEKVKTGRPLAEVENEVLALIGRYYKPNDRIVLTGNSVGNDRRFIERYMPQFAKRLHYRLLDVSSFKEIFRRRYGIEIKKKNAHRAVGDIYESIEELKTYLSHVALPSKAG